MRTSDEALQQAKALVREYLDRVINRRDVDACDELLAADYVDHDAPAGAEPGVEATKEYLRTLLARYPDLHVTIDDVIGEGDRVALRATWRGTAADGTDYREQGLVLVRLSGGRLAERWSAYGLEGGGER